MVKGGFIKFFQLYRSLEYVWKVKSKDYSNRVKKKQACDVLVTKENDKDANLDTAVKKLAVFL
jgi:hypothetical protein